MKKSLLALAVLAASGAAMAQSSVTLFGVADVGVTYVNGENNWSGLTSGNAATSRIGFRGVEDLGGGLKAGFWLEAGVNVDAGDGKSGGATTEGLAFKRRSTVGLQGGFGEVRLGRELTAAYNAVARYDVMGQVGLGYSRLWADASSNAAARTSTNIRISNMVTYLSPAIAGFRASVNYGFGEAAGNNSADRYVGAGLTYDNGPISAGLGLERQNSNRAATAYDDANAWSLGGSYDLGVAKVSAAYRRSTTDIGVNENKLDGYYVGVTAPVGPGLVRASYNRYQNELNNVTQKADHFSLGYVYNMSKRTSLYGTYSYLKNKNDGTMWGLGYATLKDNGGQSGLQVGVSHSF